MKLRTALLASTTVLVAAIMAATVFAVITVVGQAERRDLAADVARSRDVFLELVAYRQSMLRSDCHVVANEPRLRATVATLDISRETTLGVITEVRNALGSDLFLLTDASGILTADTLDPDAAGFDMSKNPVIAQALANGDGSAVWITNDRPHQVHACRIDFGARIVGVIAIGRVFDDAAARSVERQTGTTVVVSVDGQRAAASSTLPYTPGTGRPSEQPAEVEVAGQRYVMVGGRLPGYDGKRVLDYALLRSLDEALAPGRKLTKSIFVIAVIAFLVAFVVAGLVAGRMSRPVDGLVQFTRRVAKGELDTRAQPSGATEVRTLATAMNVMVEQLDKSRRELAAKERLEREMEIAMRIQTSILPRSFDVNGLDIAARMMPASEVGGDYYDVLPVRDGCWIGIGDVAGHGLTAGLEMLMVQSVVAALVRENPAANPRDHLRVLNHVVFENIRHRMKQDEHITLTLLRYSDGVVTFAGAHEEIIVCRAATGACERVATPGTWLGAMRDIGRVTEDTKLELATGDLMILYSDGITESRNADGEQYGIQRLCDLVSEHRNSSVEAIRDRVFEVIKDWQVTQDDDLSLVVVRRDPSIG